MQSDVVFRFAELCAHALCSRFDGEKVSIGYPARNVRAYIVNADTGLEQPVNVVGELWVAGANVVSFKVEPISSTVMTYAMSLYGGH